VHFDENLAAERMDSKLELAAYRVAQEALTNVMRHAGATKVWIALRRSGRALLVVLALALYPCSSLAAEPRVLVLNEANALPYSNPERPGFFGVVAIEAFRRAGVELRLVTVPAERALMLSNSGASDGELNRLASIAALYPNLIRVPEKLGEWHFAGFSKDGSIPGNFDEFRGRSVGYIRGWKIYEQAMAGAKNVITVDEPEQLFRLLQLDRIEVALYEGLMGLAHIKERGINDIQVLDPSPSQEPRRARSHARGCAARDEAGRHLSTGLSGKNPALS
jgi:polar amino acid transport system substrate-binding protein